MSRGARLHADAAAELEAAAVWYDERRNGLGLQFLAAVDRAIEHARSWPHAGSPVPELPEEVDVRRLRVSSFPYDVVYLLGDEVIQILALAHHHRRPGYWKSRTAQPDA